MRNLTLAACLLGYLAASCGAGRPAAAPQPSASPIGYPSAEAVVTFCQPVGYPDKPPAGYLVVDDGVAVPVTTPEGQPLQVSRGDFDPQGRWYFDDRGGWLWAKSGLLVRGNAEVEISAPVDSPLRFDWGEGPDLAPRRSLKVECSQKTQRWMALIGGYFSSSTGCFPLDVRVGSTSTVQVHVQMGAACPQGTQAP